MNYTLQSMQSQGKRTDPFKHTETAKGIQVYTRTETY